MRRTLVVLGVLVALCLLTVRPWAAQAKAIQTPTGATEAGTCAFTNYSLSGTFSRVGGTTSFHLGATGSCVGTSPSVVLNVDFTSVGPWSCIAGVARGAGAFQPSNGVPQTVAATLVNTGGEYVVELHSVTAAAAGQITTLPVPCVEGQIQTTIGGTGTLTYAT
ncbi:MAG TPA: hypothetical protein VG076_05790 [Acidimicrobiales bacterium]|jgi:hypothetical protein|nr:hypothetical protein [Acidimicrobiales bacterium]